jgi:hypothetical protein
MEDGLTMGVIVSNPVISLTPNIGAPQVIYMADGTAIFGCKGSPEGAIPANRGSLAIDVDNGVLYIKTTQLVNTGWSLFAQVGGGSPQSTNTVFAGPATGGAAVPSFRLLRSEDMPLAAGDGITFATAFGILTISSKVFLGDTVPTSPSSSNDEFTSAADLANWTQVNSPVVSYPSGAPSWVQINTPSSTTALRGIQKAVNSAADWTVSCKIAGARDFTNNTDCGLIVTDNAGTGIMFGLADASNGYSQLVGVKTATYSISGYGTAIAAYNVACGIGILFLRARYVQSTNRIHFDYSPDGFAWSPMFISILPDVTLTRAGIGIRGAGNSLSFLADWVRFTP